MFNPQTVSRLTHLWCGIVVLSSIGCQTYSPYGYGSYPGSYGTPVYQQPGQPVPYGSPGMAPGTVVVPPGGGGFQGGYPPPGGFQGGAPAYAPGPVTPATPYPNVPNGAMPQQGVDASGAGLGQPGQFPEASSNPPQPQVPAGGGNAVPNYPDPYSGAPRAPAKTPSIDDAADFKGDLDGAKRATEKLINMDNSPGKAGAALVRPDADDIQFGAPPPVNRRNQRTAQSGIIQTAQHVDTAGQTQRLQPYGQAPNGAWFRGLIDFDEQENLWYLIYNPEPDINDPQGGMVTLVEHPHLNLIKGDDVVLIEGQFDPSQLDTNGRPKYRPNAVRRLIP